MNNYSLYIKGEIKNKVLEYFNKVSFIPKTQEELEEIFDEENLISILEELIDEYEIFFDPKNSKYINSRMANTYKGIVSIRNPNFGFVTNPYYQDFYISSSNLKTTMNKDEVLYEVFDDEAVVLKILKRNYIYVVGKISKYKDKYFVIPNDPYIFNSILLPYSNYNVSDIVRVKLTSYKIKDGFYSGVVESILGNQLTPGIDVISILSSYDIQTNFPKEVLDEVNIIEKAKVDRIKFNGNIYTLDGESAKDLDDAISVKILDNGNYELGVYIADVSYYVKENSLIDIEAFKRGTSIYYPNGVVPMLPTKLSNDLCSLNPFEEKLVLSCIMELDNLGNVVDKKVLEGIIVTTKRLSYEKCNLVLENNEVVEGYENCKNDLILMEKLASILRKKREDNGSIDFDLDETLITLDKQGQVDSISKKERGVSEKIIEEFMIIANISVSKFIEDLELPFIYRVHDKPDNIKFQNLKNLVNSLGYKLNSIHPKEIQKLMNSLNEKESYLKNTVLRLMAKAIYSNTNIGHFGLACSTYTHFTSPIRRYPDLVVHRLLKKYLINNEIDDDFLNLHLHLGKIANDCSKTERIAQEIEYKIIDSKIASYMAKQIGNSYTGVITNLTSKGFYISLDNTVEGFVFYNHNVSYKVGDKVDVLCLEVDSKTNKITFGLKLNIKRGSYGKRKNKSYRKK